MKLYLNDRVTVDTFLTGTVRLVETEGVYTVELDDGLVYTNVASVTCSFQHIDLKRLISYIPYAYLITSVLVYPH